MKSGLALVLLLLALGGTASAKNPVVYQTGRLVDVLDRTIDIGLLFPLHLWSELRISGAGFTYSVTTDKRPDQLEWSFGDSIEFRLQGQKVFLKRPGGNDLKAKLLRVVKSDGEVGPATLTYSDPLRLPPIGSAKYAKALPLGADFLRLCLSTHASELGFLHNSDGETLTEHACEVGRLQNG